jgi:hypothetical protein
MLQLNCSTINYLIGSYDLKWWIKVSSTKILIKVKVFFISAIDDFLIKLKRKIDKKKVSSYKSIVGISKKKDR